MVVPPLLGDRGPDAEADGADPVLPELAFLGAAIALFGLFVSVGDGLRFAITGPLFSF